MYYQELSGKLLGPLVLRTSKHSRARELTTHRGIVLLITFIIYATYRMSRRPLSIVKSVFHHENCTVEVLTNRTCGWAPFDDHQGKEILGILDSSFLFVYAFGMFAAGYIAERTNIRYFLSISLTACGLLSIAFGLAKMFNIHSLWYYIVIQVLMGLSQTGLPAVISVVGQWYGTTKKGLIFGFWNWHTSVGNIVGASVAGLFVETDWSLSFIVPGFICIGVAIVVFILLIPKPSNVGIVIESNIDSLDQQNNNNLESAKFDSKSPLDEEVAKSSKGEAISVWNALLIPGVVEFSMCLFFTKLVSYTFLYWLPMYLKITSNFSSTKSAYASIMFDIGGCFGSIAAGFMSDRTGASGLTCIVFLILSIPSLYSYYLYSAKSMLLNQLLQFITGAFINGPFSLIMATVSANLACKVPSKSAMATVSAIINGTGTIGAALGPSLAGFVSATGWRNVFYMTMGADVLATLMLARIVYNELKQMFAPKLLDSPKEIHEKERY